LFHHNMFFSGQSRCAVKSAERSVLEVHDTL
jgi:hypothetical protein